MVPLTKAPPVDRAALLRRALLELVAERGFRGTSMAAVAERAGVATGTAYVHYDSKDDLVLATYLEIKAGLSAAAFAGLDVSMAPEEAFRHAWRSAYRYLQADPAMAGYLIQVESSPYAHEAHERALQGYDAMKAAALILADEIVDLPPLVIWDVGFGPGVRLAADSHLRLDDEQLETLVTACWRAVSKSG